MTWDEFFMRHVYLAASKSRDNSTGIGAVIVRHNRLIGEGYNGLPSGVWYQPETRLVRPEKYFWFEHGERNAIFSCARHGIATDGATMFTQGTPCADCARAIIQAGITEVVLHKQHEDTLMDRDKWSESAARSRAMFEEAGVRVRYLDQVLGVTCLLSGKPHDV